MALALSTCQVHAWRASLDWPGIDVERLSRLLSLDERIRAERFYFERDRKRFVVGRGILRGILGCYLGIEPSCVQFSYGAYGKPALAAASVGETLHFNVSHSDALALYAVTRGREIGVDVERVRPLADADSIAERYFSARENAVFRALPANEKLAAFFNCWTRKEAYAKACGEGLGAKLSTIEVSLTPGQPARLLSINDDPQETSRWFLQELSAGPDYAAALVVEGDGWHLIDRQWPGLCQNSVH